MILNKVMIVENSGKELREIYQELIADFFSQSLDENQIIKQMMIELSHYANALQVAFYRFDLTQQMYQLNNCLTEEKHLKVNHSILKHYEYKKEMIFIHRPGAVNLEIIPLSMNNDMEGLLVLVFSDNKIKKGNLADLKKETEKFLSVIYFADSDKLNRFYPFLYELSLTLFSKYERQQIFSEIFKALETVYPDFSYYLLLAQDNEIDLSLPIQTLNLRDDINKSMAVKAFISGEILTQANEQSDANHIYAPLNGKQGTYGVLKMVIPRNIHLSKMQYSFLKEFARLTGMAIEKASLYENSKYQVSTMTLINEFAKKLNANLELIEITKILKNEIISICDPSEIGFIYFNDTSSKEITLEELSTDYFKTDEGRKLTSKLFNRTRKDSELIFSGNLSKEYETNYESIIAIPMNHSDLNQGLTILLHKKKYYFTFETFKVIEAMIQHATFAIANAYLKGKLHKAVITDYLTGLYSRNFLEERIKEDMENGDKGVLLLFDIDDFKKVNDQYGHHVGDEVIKQVANVMKSMSRHEEIAARWGGEELAIYLPNTTLDESMDKAEMIRTMVETGTNPKVTLSCGGSSWTKRNKDTVINLFVRTDQALYDAKRLGKNRVIKN